MIRESRLIGANLKDFNSTTKYNSRTAAANAQVQTDARQTNLANKPSTYQTYIDPKTGTDSRNPTQSLTPVYYGATPENPMGTGEVSHYAPNMQMGAGKLSTLRLAGNVDIDDPAANDASRQLQAAQNTYANKAAGFNTEYVPGQQGVYDPVKKVWTQTQSGGVTQLSGQGGIQQSAIDNLRKHGLSDEEIRTRLNDPAYMAKIQSTMSNTGLGGSFDANGKFIPQGQDGSNLLFGDQLRQQLDATNMPANVRDFLYKSLKDVQTPTSSGGQEPSKAAPTPGENVNAPTGSQQAPGAGALDQAAAAYPGLTGAFDEIKNLLAQQQKQNESLTLAQLKGGTVNIGGQDVTLTGSEQTANAIDKKIADMETGFSAAADKVQGLLDQAKQQQDDLIAKQEQSARERLAWTENQMLRNTERQKRQAHESLVVQFALNGGYGQPSAIKEVMSSDQEFENRMDDIKSEFGVQRTELSAQFTALSIQNSNNYIGKTIENARTLQSQIERTSLQSISNMQARQQAEQKHVQDYFARQDGIMMEYAKTNLDHAKTMQAMINQERDDKRAQEQLGLNMLNTFADNYGNNVPQSLVKMVKKYLPDVNVQEVMQARTLAQMKKGAGGAGIGSGLSYGPSQRSATGEPIALDKFLSQKESDWHKTSGEAGPASPQQRKSWEKEYKAMEAEHKRLTAEGILSDLAIKTGKAGTFTSVTQLKKTEANVHEALNNGDLELARSIVDGAGRPPPEKTPARIANLQRLMVSLDEMDQLLDGIQEKVGPFPTQGPLWSWMNENIETTPEYQRMLTLKGTNLAPYSRSVSGETGASTEGDVQRAVAGLLQSNVSAPAMRAALNEARKQSEMAITMYLRSMRDAGYAVNDLQQTYDSGVWRMQEMPSEAPLSQTQQDFLNTF